MSVRIVRIVVRGRVQGVGYRAFVEGQAAKYFLEGFVRNRRDGSVEAAFAGSPEAVAAAIEACRRGPPGALVDSVDVEEGTSELLRHGNPAEGFSVVSTV